MSKKRKHTDTGKFLRECRESLGHSIPHVSDQLKIRAKYIKHMEKNEFHKLPGAIYAEGYLRNYAKFLRIDPEDIIADYRESMTESEQSEGEFLIPQEHHDMQKPTPTILAICAALIIVIYAVWYIQRDFGRMNARLAQPATLAEQEDSSIVLLAAGDVEVELFVDKSAPLSTFAMRAGDTYFIPHRDQLRMQVSDLSAIDMFIEGEPVNARSSVRADGSIALDPILLRQHRTVH